MVNRSQVERQSAKCSQLEHMAVNGATLDRRASQLDALTESELTAKFDSWIKNPDSSPQCVFFRRVMASSRLFAVPTV